MIHLPTPRLPYRDDALEPILHHRQVRAHFDLHHQDYYKKAKALLKKRKQGRLRAGEAHELSFNLNGNRLHQLWWDNLSPFTPRPRPLPAPPLVLHAFGGTTRTLKKEIRDVGLGVEGSGWVCLSWNKSKLEAWVHPVYNHDYEWRRWTPLLVLDVWEHSYYLDYLNDRKDYLHQILKVVDWDVVVDRLEPCL